MTKKMTPIEVELRGRTREAVQEVPVRREDRTLTTVGSLVEEARRAYDQANKALQDNALIQLTAAHLMRKEKRRGTPSIVIRMDGSVALRVSYGENDDETGEEPLPITGPSLSSKYPSLSYLRKQAAAMGVDISDLGRKKREILKRLEAHRENSVEDPDIG